MQTEANPALRDSIDTALRYVIDPELGLNLVDLGLIYSIDVDGDRVVVRMTLTTRGCPMHQSLVEGVRRALLSIPSIREADVELVWEPPWHPTMISPETRRQLGIGT
jgi:metal-sulfur cluster biosynthetic enzyme